VQFEIANEQIVALPHKADVARQIVVQENRLCFIFPAHLVVYQVSLGERVVVVESVDALSLSVAIINVFLHVETVHENEIRWLRLLE